MLSLLVLMTLGQADAGAPPGLTCLPRWYAGSVTQQRDGGWGLQLDSGVYLPWESQGGRDAGLDGGTDPADLLEVTALSDIYRPTYRTGPIVAIDVSDAGAIEDPGRARVEQLFLATYGGTKQEVENHLGNVRFMGQRYAFHELAAGALSRVVTRLQTAVKEKKSLLPFVQDIGGTFIWRKIARSKNLSTHAFGIAIDVNVDRSNYWRWTFKGQPMVWKNKVPQEIVDAFEAEGFIWGGRWAHYDTMHFEYRPELTSPLCR